VAKAANIFRHDTIIDINADLERILLHYWHTPANVKVPGKQAAMG